MRPINPIGIRNLTATVSATAISQTPLKRSQYHLTAINSTARGLGTTLLLMDSRLELAACQLGRYSSARHLPFKAPKQATVEQALGSRSSATQKSKLPVEPSICRDLTHPSIGICIWSGNGGFGHNPHGVWDGDGVIIVGHGEFVAMFRERTGYFIVEPARVDIPSLTAEAAKEHPSMCYIVTAPLGLHRILVDVVNDRINHCLSHVAGDADECAFCFGTSKCRLH